MEKTVVVEAMPLGEYFVLRDHAFVHPYKSKVCGYF